MSENLTQDPARNDAEPEQPTDVESINEHDESVLDVVEADVQAITGGDVDADTLDTASDDDGDVAPAASTSRQGQLEREGEVAADFLETLLDICDLDGDLEVDIDGDRAAVSIVDSEDGRVPRRLVGQNGQVLDALQELTRLAVQSATGERSRLMLDVGGHRAARRARLVAVGKEGIEEGRPHGGRQPPAALCPIAPHYSRLSPM